jgi:hypothetical protein
MMGIVHYLLHFFFNCFKIREHWKVLMRHTNDSSLSGNFSFHSWPISGVITSYRYFRILQTGHNSSDRNYLVLAGIEVYGELFEE